jgi:hypothetical protein
VTFEGDDIAGYDDITPKLGVAYDLSGNGRAAVRASLSKYVAPEKALAAYTVPRVEVQLVATVQSIPRPVVNANVVYPSGVIAGTLSRPLSGNVATAVVNVIPTATEYGDRLNQLDFRVGKILRLSRARLALDLFNALNSDAVLTENASFAVFRQPLAVLNPRLVKFSANVDFWGTT